MAKFWFLLAMLGVILAVQEGQALTAMSSFVLVKDKFQSDSNYHAIIDLKTSKKTTECANYCIMRGSVFR